MFDTRATRAASGETPARPGLLDDSVRAGQDGLRNGQAERLGGGRVDDQLDLRGLLDRQIGRLGSLERSEEHTSELQSLRHLVCRLLLEKKKINKMKSQE